VQIRCSSMRLTLQSLTRRLLHTSLQPSSDTSEISASLFGSKGTTKSTAPLPTRQKRSKKSFWALRLLEPTNIPTSTPKTTALSCFPNPFQTASKLVTPPKYNGSLCALPAYMHPIHQSTNHLPLRATYAICFAISPQSCDT
jgi:hypothetical protein